MKEPNPPGRCPSCAGPMRVERLSCTSCGTEVQGRYRPCPVCGLDPEARKLFDLFLQARGNLKDVQRSLGLSYPTVRLRIEEMFRKLEGAEQGADPMEILQRVRRGELSVEEAERMLRQ